MHRRATAAAVTAALVVAGLVFAWRVDVGPSELDAVSSGPIGPRDVSVWRCLVPLSTSSDWYEPSDFRLDLTVDQLVERLAPVAQWFNGQSNGNFTPKFVPGGDVALADDVGPESCAETAEQQVEAVDGVRPLIVIVGTAEHRADRPGGWGRPGVAYIGAADFHPDWGEHPALDLVEHELGHALGMTHSGVGDELNSALDLMSDSAAPRRVDSTRRHAPGILAVHRHRMGWMRPGHVVELGESGGEVMLAANHAFGDIASALLAFLRDEDDAARLAIEVKRALGDDAHLRGSGVVIHRVEDDGDLTPLVGTAPFDLPLGDGDEWSGDGWTITVQAIIPETSDPEDPLGGAGRAWQVSYRFDERLRSD